jgi:WD40 repeat protein
MPSVYSKTRPPTIQPFPVPQPDFAFPSNKHLLITTPSRIVSWDATGIHELFKSGKSGIAAATESKDGSGILAVADKHVVVLHDTQRGKEKSWGLSGPEDEVRHLEYTRDSKSLFLTTTATNAIQCYSAQAQQLLSPPQTLASPAVALAISATGHLMISAQGTPPVVFVKDLTKNSTATLLKPQASTAGVTIAAFHPERANIFLLAFDDGTLAVFDATRLKRGNGEGKYNDQSHAGKAEMGRKMQLHRPMHFKTEGRSRAITGAAFLPGNKLKTITVGIDGRCKLLDFSDSANVLRTWHCEAPLACVSVSGSVPPEHVESALRKSNSSKRLEFSGNLIAVGSQDGRVRLYDSLGLLQSLGEIGTNGERIISVEWVDGASPRSVCTGITTGEPAVQLLQRLAESSAKRTQAPKSKKTTPKHLSVHPALRPSTTNPIASRSMQSRKFTVHPDEVVGDSTVRHTPNTQGNYMVSAEAGEYLDLFSPVNPFIAEKTRANRDFSFSPTRVRPRISSQTFAQDMSKLGAGSAKTALTQPPVLTPAIDSHATSSGSIHTGAKRNVAVRSAHSTARGSPLKAERRRPNPASVRKRRMYRTDSAETVDPTVVANAKLLRELRQMGARTATIHEGAATKSNASTNVSPVARNAEQSRIPAIPKTAVVGALPTQAQVQTQVYGSGGRWPTDSVDEPSWSDEQQDDIWITSDEERNKSSRRIYGIERPAARQTSRSRMDSNGTVSTTQAPARSPAVVAGVPAPKATGGPTSTDDYTTAPSHVSPDGAFSLVSNDVKSLFPRTSSRSPKKTGTESRKTRETPKHRKTALQEIASNAAVSRRTSNPWSKVKQLRGLPQDTTVVGGFEHQMVTDHAVRPHTRGDACSGCTDNAGKVRALQGEVSHMKGEILALRAMLRRNGIPTPAVPRR